MVRIKCYTRIAEICEWLVFIASDLNGIRLTNYPDALFVDSSLDILARVEVAGVRGYMAIDHWKQKIAGVRDLPAEVKARVEDYLQSYQTATVNAGLSVPTHPEFIQTLKRVWAYSDFVAQTCMRSPGLLDELCRSGQLFLSESGGAVQRRVDKAVLAMPKVPDESELMRVLRVQRRREMLRIAVRDLAGWAPLEETLRDLSLLADACITAVSTQIYAWTCAEWGTPIGHESGRPQEFVVLAMGKLGAHELNFSSDIDLIFAFPENGDTVGGQRSISNEEFFLRVAQRFINQMDTITADGWVFRVDMRLRPFGDSGPMVSSFPALEIYYLTHGREWERYAMIKARPVNGSDSGMALINMLTPFIYRRYLDFGAFAALRDMKALIASQVQRKGMERDIKLGVGGIREIEFIGQLFQLVRGGREPALRQRGIVPVLQALATLGYLPSQASDELITAYIFLRHTENRLQAFTDAQTHNLPEDESTQLRIALAMGYADWPSFAFEVARQRAVVQGHFNQIFHAPEGDQAAAPVELTVFDQVWRQPQTDRGTQILAEHGFGDGEAAADCLSQLLHSATYRTLSDRGRGWLDRLMPQVVAAASATQDPIQTLRRVINIVESIGRRSSYYALLVEYSPVLTQLVRLCAASPWITSYLAQHPVLLDELLDPRTLYRPAKHPELAQELAAALSGVPAEDVEQQMEQLRQFVHTHVLRVAAADVAEAIPLMVVSDHLTDIAEVVIAAALDLAWRHLVAKHGLPRTGGESTVAGFAVIGYGKLGGIELGYGSDLDVVFLHDSLGGTEVTDGPRSIDNAVFFARLAQRVIHLLTTHTPSGIAYEVDTRLRPSGASGLLVTSVASFREYQSQRAWTWEHQALVRARSITGDPKVMEVFSHIREGVLARTRDPIQLQRDVREMRLRMRQELANKDPTWFDLKQDTGGIIDIEFIVQYLVLRWAADVPELTRWPDNIRNLEALRNNGVLTAEEAEGLSDAYRALRKEIHRCKLQDAPARVPATEFVAERLEVSAIFDRYLVVVEGLTIE